MGVVMSNSAMSSPINITRFNALVIQYLSARITANRLASLAPLSDQTFSTLVNDLDKTIVLYNSFPACLAHSPYSSDLFVNTTHLKSIYSQPLPSYSSILKHLRNNSSDLDTAFSEMRESTYFHDVYQINQPSHLLANLMTLIYRCHLLAIMPTFRENKAQISSTLEEMSSLRYLLGEDSLYFQSVRHWVMDWKEEGFSQELSFLTSNKDSSSLLTKVKNS